MTNFFFNFYNPQAASLANKGRSPSAFYYLGRAVGFVVSLPAQPLIWTGSVIRYLINKPASKYYYLKPAMPLYWSAVSNMVNMIGVNMGVIARGLSKGDQYMRPFDKSHAQEEHLLMRRAMAGATPNIFRGDGGVDIYSIATRAQRMSYINRINMRKALEDAGSWSAFQERMRSAMRKPVDDIGPQNQALHDYVKSFHEAQANQNTLGDEEDRVQDADTVGGRFENLADPQDDTFGKFLKAELEDGSAFVTFRVDHQSEVSESFSNSVGESGLASMINSAASAGRNARFSFSDGNFGDGPLASMAEGAAKAAGDVVTGVLDSVRLSGLMALTGSAFADIPKVWESSSANFPTASYTIELRSPYGAPYARFQNLMVPLCMLLAGVLPLATGKQSYTSPFLCELYSQGRQQIRLGMIESMSISRGTGNLGWTRHGEPLGIDVSFTVADLSSVLHMPITSNFGVMDALGTGALSLIGKGLDAKNLITMGAETNYGEKAEEIASLLDRSTYDDDNAFTDYMSVLGSLGLADQIYPTNKLRLRRAQRAANWEQWKSPAYHANWIAGTTPGRVASMVAFMLDPEAGIAR